MGDLISFNNNKDPDEPPDALRGMKEYIFYLDDGSVVVAQTE